MSDYSSLAGGRISPYDETIQKEAERLLGLALLTALIYHESRFNPQARSWAGAGLMQLMPSTVSVLVWTAPPRPRGTSTPG